MPEETTTVSESPSTAVAGEFGEILYWVSVPLSDFDLASFRSGLPSSVSQLDDSTVTVNSKEENGGRYHVLFSWKVTSEDVRFRIEYHGSPGKRVGEEREPYAEDLMRWLGTFFSVSNIKCHVHARLEYPLDKRQTTFPLKLSTELPAGATMNGISLTLRANSQGASSVKMTRGKSHWYAEVVADRTLNFSDFSPYADETAASAVLGIFLGEHES